MFSIISFQFPMVYNTSALNQYSITTLYKILALQLLAKLALTIIAGIIAGSKILNRIAAVLIAYNAYRSTTKRDKIFIPEER